MYYQSLQIYFSEVYNIFDFAQPILFIVHLILRMLYAKIDGYGWMKLFDNLIEIFIIIGSTMRLFQYIRFKEEYSYFVQMFFSVLIELGPFLLIFVILTFVFTMFQIILNAKASDGGSDYPGVHPYIRKLI